MVICTTTTRSLPLLYIQCCTETISSIDRGGSHFRRGMAMGVGRIFFRGGSRGFSQKFFQGGPKVVKFVFYLSKLKKQPFLPKVSKSKGKPKPPLLPFRRPWPWAFTQNIFLEIICLSCFNFVNVWAMSDESAALVWGIKAKGNAHIYILVVHF